MAELTLHTKIRSQAQTIAAQRAEIERLESENAAYREVWRLLRDQTVVVAQDGAVFAKIAEWANAPSNTASASLEFGAALGGEDG